MATMGGRRWPPVLVAVLAVLVVAGVLAAILVSDRGSGPVTPPPTPPAAGPGPANVELSADAKAHPMGEAVRATMQRHFNAINAKDYAGWSSTVVAERVRQQPETDWRMGFRTTQDGTIQVTRIDRLGPGRLLLLVYFVSVQDPADAPPKLRADRICWQAAFPMVGNPPIIDVGREENLVYNAC